MAMRVDHWRPRDLPSDLTIALGDPPHEHPSLVCCGCLTTPDPKEGHLKIPEEIMEILEAFDLVESLRDAGELAGCSHNTVARYVELREAGKLSAEPARRVQLIDPYLDKLEEWMEASKGKLRADRAHKKLEALGFSGSPRTTRRAVASARRNWGNGNRRLYRPWIPEPGMWFQWDFGDGPEIEGRKCPVSTNSDVSV
jgi:hypothetical protein